MAGAQGGSGLQIIFSFFLGLMVTTFIGVGVYTFHPPNEELDRRIQEINREERFVQDPTLPVEASPEEQANLRALQAEREELIEAAREEREEWGRSTSIVLVVLATLVMAISLVRSDQLPVISNGLLLGGVFTMVYGVGWIVASDTSLTRFAVVTVAFVITLALGYLRFVQRREGGGSQRHPGGGGATAVPDGGELAELRERVHLLEKRLEAAGRAIEGRSG